jgi:16S rRNA processing protein RimM
MGRISGAFGIKGWVKVQPFTVTPDGLTAHRTWWIEKDGSWARCEVEQAEVQGAAVAAKLAGCDDRDAAALYRGREIAVPRSALPEAGENEFYWADLIGLRVVNEAGEDLGAVGRVLETGANDVLVVEGDRERLIPFIEHVVRQVDLGGGVIRVDWGSDY